MATISEQAVQEAEARMLAQLAAGPTAVTAHYDLPNARLRITLSNGLELAFPPHLAEGLADAKPDELAEIELSPTGLGVHFPSIDADLYLPALLQGLMGSSKWMAQALGAKGGSSTSSTKAAAARENGKLGGRPRQAVAQKAPLVLKTNKDSAGKRIKKTGGPLESNPLR
jgi:hypothetical protein